MVCLKSKRVVYASLVDSLLTSVKGYDLETEKVKEV